MLVIYQKGGPELGVAPYSPLWFYSTSIGYRLISALTANKPTTARLLP